MDRLAAMELFIAAVDEGSLASGARRFGRSPATATRAVALLEDAAGETLLLRSTRGLRLTAAGERQIAIWREVLDRLAGGHEEDPGFLSGSLALTAPELFGRLKVTPIVEDFLEQHPKLHVRLLLLNRLIDMVGEGIDVALRLAHLQDSAMVAVRLGEVRQMVCAAPSYIDHWGEPRDPSDLAGHHCIGTGGEGDRELWAFAIRRSEPSRSRSIQIRTRLSLNSAGAGLDAALRGRGVVRALSYQVAEEIVAGRLRVVLQEFEPDPTPVNIVFRANPRKWSPVRLFVDYAVPILREELSRIAGSVM